MSHTIVLKPVDPIARPACVTNNNIRGQLMALDFIVPGARCGQANAHVVFGKSTVLCDEHYLQVKEFVETSVRSRHGMFTLDEIS